MIFLLLSCAAGEREWVFDTAPDALRATFGNGDVTVRAADRDGAVVVWSGTSVGAIPHVGLLDGVLLVGAECRVCGGSLDIAVPSGIPVDVVLGEGAVDIELDEASDVAVELDHGSVTIAVPAGGYDLRVRGVAAAVSLDGVVDDPAGHHAISVWVDAGDVSIVGR